MRLTALRGATVVRDSGWETRGLARAQDEARNSRLEGRSVLTQKTVVALHPAFPRLQDAEALIFVHRPGHDGRLLADHSFPNDLRVHAVPDGVVNEPAASEQLGGHRSHVLDANEIGEDVVALRRLRVIAQIDRPYGDANSLGLSIEEARRGHECKLVAKSEPAPRGEG